MSRADLRVSSSSPDADARVWTARSDLITARLDVACVGELASADDARRRPADAVRALGVILLWVRW
jgi:hypothetical protein